MMRRRKLNPRLLRGKSPNTPPAVFGEWRATGAKQTLILYAHYDGQPTEAKQWDGTLPWQPTIRSSSLEDGGKILPLPTPASAINSEWRIYARSASDDKAGVLAILTAFDALRTQGIEPKFNLKFFFEGEEEAGSPHLAEIIQLNKSLLQADAWIICDGPVHQAGSKQVVFGVRGDTNVELTVYGAKRPLHSGHYGNWAPNPAQLLTSLLASMKDASGRVSIAGWYDDVQPLGEAEVRAIENAPKYDDDLKTALGFSISDGGGKTLLELINLPSLNINGISSGDVGQLARNVIPTTASAVLDLRLVKGNDFNRQVGRLEDHIRKQGFFVVRSEPTSQQRLQYSRIIKVI
ncbi:MAG TPA: M20/M25/M40 family metallo-hydrolase, partial [Pyrinomonadaceae bacterium]|nr:M20/M25/M40 family metallo-hydrolase [Pyrinomonadaceae bacterium]